MKANFLFPSYFKYIGWMLAVPGLVLGYFVVFWQYEISGFELLIKFYDKNNPKNLTNTLALALSIVGLMFSLFAKVKNENSSAIRLRIEAMLWAMRANYICYAIYLLFWDKIIDTLETWFGYAHIINVFGPNFSSVNLVLPLVICLLRFQYLIWYSREESTMSLKLLAHKPYYYLGIGSSLIIICLACLSLLDERFPAYKSIFDSLFDYLKFLPFALLLWISSLSKGEGEHIYNLRLLSLRNAININYGTLFVANLFIYDLNFVAVEYIEMIGIPILFVICFQYQLYISKNIIL